MTGPVPDPENGTLDTVDCAYQQDALADYLVENKAAFTLQYVPKMKHWTGLLVHYDGRKSFCTIGKYPTEVIYLLLKEALA